ncbi:unnamed protein product [Adineta ricciae]|uniref:Uncharacterized protein n=1 Tax=Adineta ricciae TaxID=249248 RepID=A0A816AFQ1_ADIRI|nr:unnamed protein product [Adineta ricciae]
MSFRPPIVTSKQCNRINNPRLYASFSEGVDDSAIPTTMTPRDVYLYRGLDKDLLKQKPATSRLPTSRSKSNLTGELLKRYKQSMAPSHPAYHSALTIDEALNPPWALQYNIKRQPATPNFISNATNKLTLEDSARRLQSAPLVRSPTPSSILHIPEPRLETVPTPSVKTTDASQMKPRSSSANGHYDGKDPADQKQRYHDSQPDHICSSQDNTKLSDNKCQQCPKLTNDEQLERPVQIIFTKTDPSSIPPPPIYVYKKSATWIPDDGSSLPSLQRLMEPTPVPLNPHYVHRPGIVAADNGEKKVVAKPTPPSKKPGKNRHNKEKRTEPLVAVTQAPLKTKLSVETEGVKLTYDPRLTLDDKSPNLQKYFIDGRLYLIKDHRYNVLNNVDPSTIQKVNRQPTLSTRPKYYQTVSIDKYQLPKPSFEIHYNAPETFFYNTMPKYRHRYIINPNFISENLNVNKVSLGERPPTTTIYA